MQYGCFQQLVMPQRRKPYDESRACAGFALDANISAHFA